MFAEEEFWPQNSNFSSKKSFCKQGKTFFSQKTRTSRFGTKTSWKGIQENTSLSNIYWRFYWPGSYAPRGVIDQYMCLQMGLPFFSWLYYRHKLMEFVKLFSIKANRIYKKTAENVPDLYFHHNFLHLLYNVLKVLIDSNPWVLRNILVCIFS